MLFIALMPMASSAKRKACGKNVRPRGVWCWLKAVKPLMLRSFTARTKRIPLGSLVEAGSKHKTELLYNR